LDGAVHRMDHCPVDNAIGFPITYPLDGGLSGGWRCPAFERLGPGCYVVKASYYFSLYEVTYITGYLLCTDEKY